MRGQRASGTCSCTRFQRFIKPLDPQRLAQHLYIWGQYINQEKIKLQSIQVSRLVIVEMLHKKLIVQYSDGQFQFKVFIMYADFESILEPMHGPENNPRISSMRGINNHIPSGWCVHSEFAYGKVENPLKLYHGEDCIKRFCDHVIGEARRLYQSLSEKPMKPLTPKEMDRYKRSERCHICFKLFKEDKPKVRDHCHYTGRYRGPAHTKCNL